MNILQLITELHPGSAKRSLLELSRGLVAAGQTVRVCSLRRPPPCSPVVEELQELGIPVYSLGLSYAQPWRSAQLRTMIRHMHRIQSATEAAPFVPQIVHAQSFHAGLVAALALGPRESWRLVYSTEPGEARSRRQWPWLVERWIMRRAQVVTAASAAAQAHYAAAVPAAPAPIRLLPGPGVLPPGELAQLFLALCQQG